MQIGLLRACRTAAAALSVLATCGFAAQAETPKDVLVVGHVAELQTLDPAQSVTISDFRILSNIYEGLVRYKENSLEIEPGLATSWTVSPDKKTYTFKLRNGVKFQDGSPFNAEAVKFDIDRVIDKNHPYNNTGPFPFTFLLGPIESTEAPDPMTVVIHLKEPYAPMLTMLGSAIGGMTGVSPEAVKKYGKEFSRHGGGTGPFMLTTWESGQRFVLTANKDYWGPKPKLSSIVFRPIIDENARVSEMLSGGTDLTIEVPPDNVATFKDSKKFTYLEQAGPHIWYLLLNLKEKPFDDKRVRQAANYAINKEALVTQILKGTATVAAGPTPAAFAVHDGDLKPYPYDPAKAKKLLADAGYPNGVDVTFFVTESGSGMLSPTLMGTAIQADLAAVGIRAKIETYEWNTFLGKILHDMKGVTNMAELSFMSQDPDMHPALTLRGDGGINSGGYSNPKVDELLAAGRTESDPAKRAAIYKQFQEIVNEDAPWIFICNWKQNAVEGANVKGFQLHPSFTLRLWTVYKE